MRKVLADREDDIKLIRKQWLKEKKNEANKTESIIQGYTYIRLVRDLKLREGRI